MPPLSIAPTDADLAAPGDTSTDPPPMEPNGRRKLLRTKELFALGLLKPGMRLSIKGHPGSEAMVVDGQMVEFRGERLSYNVWGCRVTGWVSIQIYTQALLEDGRLLEELRRAAVANGGGEFLSAAEIA